MLQTKGFSQGYVQGRLLDSKRLGYVNAFETIPFQYVPSEKWSGHAAHNPTEGIWGF